MPGFPNVGLLFSVCTAAWSGKYQRLLGSAPWVLPEGTMCNRAGGERGVGWPLESLLPGCDGEAQGLRD